MPSTGVPGLEALGDERVEAELVHAAHRRREGADAGQDHAVGAADALGVGGDHGLARRRARAPSRPSAGCPSRSRGSRSRSRAHSVSVPLVDGTPVSPGSISTASRSARANALKQASIMWWALEP